MIYSNHTKLIYKVMTDKKITSTEKVLMALILRDTNAHNESLSTNQEMCEWMDCEPATISKLIKGLIGAGYLTTSVTIINGRIRRIIKVNSDFLFDEPTWPPKTVCEDEELMPWDKPEFGYRGPQK